MYTAVLTPFTYTQPDEEAALLHYNFGAMGGDPLSSMALGHRHMQGQGVPKSCWTAASYYAPVAESVADLASGTAEERLPQIERMRISVQSQQGGRAERQREVG